MVSAGITRHARGLSAALPLMLLLLTAVSAACLPAEAAGAQEPSRKYVSLVIDYGDGVEKHFTQLTWREQLTVLDAMTAAAQHRRGIKFQHRGAGATAFLISIDDLKNEGTKRNWIFRVNGKLADRSFGITTLKPGDTILWKFGEYR